MPSYRRTKQLIHREISKQQDLKTSFRETGNYSLTNNWTVSIIPFPPRGGLVTERTTDDFYVKSIDIRYRIEAPETDDFVRVVLVQYLFPVDEANFYSAGTISNVFMQGDLTSFPSLDHFNSQTRSLYRVLYDKSFNIDDSAGPRARFIHINLTAGQIPEPKLHIIGDDGWTGNWQITSGAIVLFQCSNSSIAPNPQANFNWKVNFVDG